MSLAPPIDRLGPDALDACLALARDRRWHPDRRRWRLLFEFGEVYGVRDPGGGLAGCVSLTRYGSGLAVVGMLLVASRHGRRGLGRRLMEHVLAAAGDATVFLYATAPGRPLYERLGFRTIGTVTTSVGRFTAAPAGGTRPAAPADGEAIAALDAAALGGDRRGLLAAYLRLADRVRVLERDGAVRGFAVAAARDDTVVVGPLVAPDADAARTLIADAAARRDAPVRLDLDQGRDGLLDWARERGVMPGDDVALMVRGDRALPGARERLVLPLMLALG